MGAIRDLTGQRFFRLLVLNRLPRLSAKADTKYECLCDCGKQITVAHGNLIRGLRNNGTGTKSCSCLRNSHALPAGIAAKNRVFYNYEKGAKTRGYEFEITFEQFEVLTKQKCHYCNCEPSMKCRVKGGNGSYIYNGLDRVDNSIGYKISNIVPCCNFCNRAKKCMSQEEFIERCVAVARHQQKVA